MIYIQLFDPPNCTDVTDYTYMANFVLDFVLKFSLPSEKYGWLKALQKTFDKAYITLSQLRGKHKAKIVDKNTSCIHCI